MVTSPESVKFKGSKGGPEPSSVGYRGIIFGGRRKFSRVAPDLVTFMEQKVDRTESSEAVAGTHSETLRPVRAKTSYPG